jgi:hypothetical protein
MVNDQSCKIQPGRRERRAAERAKRKSEIRMTPERIQEMKNKAAKEACRRVEQMQQEKAKETTRAVLDMLILFGMKYLHDEKHYGRKRLEDYYDGCMRLLTEFEQGKCTLKSIRDQLVEETGIQLSEV